MNVCASLAINEWNNLAGDCVNSGRVDIFKNKIDKISHSLSKSFWCVAYHFDHLICTLVASLFQYTY